jgi:hypothetical protein
MNWEGLLRMSLIPGRWRYAVLDVYMLGRCWGKSFSLLEVEKQDMEGFKGTKSDGIWGKSMASIRCCFREQRKGIQQ